MAYLNGIRSNFPEQIDTILELFNLPPSQKDNAARYQYLATKENLSSLEQTELNNLSVILQDYLPDVETWNLFGDILINMQKFFKEGVEPFVNNLKDNALNEIENKKQDIIDYMDQTTAGAIRNDIGVMGDSTIEGRSLIDKTNNLDNKINNLSAEVDEHKAENVQHLSYSTASGTNTYNTTIDGISSLVEGMSFKIKFANANTGASTLNINGLGAKAIQKANGSGLSAGNIRVEQICHLVYTGSVFQLLGEGGEYGTAQAQDVLEGKTIGTEEGLVTGTMPNRGAINRTITTQGGQIVIPKGYHNGSGKVKAQFANLVPENIKKGVNVGGVVGSHTKTIKSSPFKSTEKFGLYYNYPEVKTFDFSDISGDIIGAYVYAEFTGYGGSLAKAARLPDGEFLMWSSLNLFEFDSISIYNKQLRVNMQKTTEVNDPTWLYLYAKVYYIK